MHRIKIKPLSVNEAWQGRRFKTKKYDYFSAELKSILPKLTLPESPYSISLVFGISKASDIDNPIKPVLDILSQAYKFNDNLVHSLVVRKQVVKRGGEFIGFEIRSFAEVENLA